MSTRTPSQSKRRAEGSVEDEAEAEQLNLRLVAVLIDVVVAGDDDILREASVDVPVKEDVGT